MATTEKLLLSAAEAAAYLGISRRQLYGLVEHRAVPPDAIVRSGRALFFLRPRLEEWIGKETGGVHSAARDKEYPHAQHRTQPPA